MAKRITAWVLLIGFLLLIMNLFWWRFAPELSLTVYIVILLYGLFSKKLVKSDDDQNDDQTR
ncbi:MAG: hypothetical protein ACOX3Q_09830 [Clostridia bacterium]|jgi:hypothetical protein|nr:hypothetical protein [Clostridiaceae bacterium]